ncbi:MAG: 2Fe-2S iron-sulfur cluster binding domain-containing protein, partial [Actinobacteria bacterium]|nr:2Fe-2S iron-sulfur cluster binding domain-containing protein [Actinomycetota bacterium]
MTRLDVAFALNGTQVTVSTEARKPLVDVLREDLGLTGTNIGCEQGNCGTCTVLLDGRPVRACLLFAVQVSGHTVTTIEGVGDAGDLGEALQHEFCAQHALQCGFCTPGMIMAAIGLLSEVPAPSDEDIRDALNGNICRCTGYMQIIEACGAPRRGRSAAGRRAKPRAVDAHPHHGTRGRHRPERRGRTEPHGRRWLRPPDRQHGAPVHGGEVAGRHGG